MKNLIKEDAFNTISETLKYLHRMEKDFNVYTPRKTKIEFINVLLHVFELYKPNENLKYMLLDGFGCVVKITSVDLMPSYSDDQSVDNLNMGSDELDTIIETIITKSYDDAEDYLSIQFKK